MTNNTNNFNLKVLILNILLNVYLFSILMLLNSFCSIYLPRFYGNNISSQIIEYQRYIYNLSIINTFYTEDARTITLIKNKKQKY